VEELEDGVSSAMIPNFVLQPLVEWLVEHALNHQCSSYIIHISGRKHSQQLVLCVEDDGMITLSSDKEQQQDDAYCSIVIDRLSHLYHDKQSFQLTRNATGGMTIQIQIPFQEQQQPATTQMVLENPL
jgi:LytS/YehU family sensor histidine kinase